MKPFTLLLLFLIFIQPISSFGQDKNTASFVTITKSDLQNKNEIKLNSGWQFYWKDFIEPGAFYDKKPLDTVSLKNWTTFLDVNNKNLPSFGYATYKLNFSIPKDRPSLSLFIPKIYSANKIWINGKFVSKKGIVKKTKSETLHRRFSQIIPLNNVDTDFEIVIHVANFFHHKGGIDTPIILGTTEKLLNKAFKKTMADIIFIGCLGILGLFFMLFYIFYWKKDKAVIYFALLCILFSYNALSDRYAPLTHVFRNISWILLSKIEYLTLFSTGLAANLFFNDIFKKFTHKLIFKLFLFSFGSISVLAILLPSPYYSKLVFPFLILLILNLFYATYIIIKAIKGEQYNSILLFISMVLGSVTFFIHIIVFLGDDDNTIFYVNFAYILVFLLLSMLLMHRFSSSFKKLELANALAIQQKKEIFEKSKEIKKANLKLEENLTILENYNAELDDFNHIVSHDLKSPLVSVYSLATFIEDDLDDKIDDNTKNYLNLLKDVVSKMEASINGLLEYSKVAKGKKRKELFKLEDLLKNISNFIDNQKNCIINLKNTDFEVFTNKLELEHVFQNLISNSIKYNDKDKTIVTISAIKEEHQYLFSVSDNGPGVDEKYHSKIFKIFNQLDINQKDVDSTGVGLAIVKKIISKNNGTISVKSKKGEGLTISFTWKIDNNVDD